MHVASNKLLKILEIMDVPSIDLNNFTNSQEYKKLREASEEWGCFRLVNHKIPLTLMSEMKKVVSDLLDRPMEIKMKNKDVIAGSGYIAPSKVNPLYETLGLYDFGSSQAVDTFCTQLDASSYEREVIEKYAAAVHELMEDICLKLAESLGSNGESVKEWCCMFRINKYNFTPESVGSLGVQLHTDSGFLTILQADENVGGLEVMEKSGAFVPVDASPPGTLLVNLGDIATVWSNGRVCNVKHRVHCLEASIRVSIASFMLGPKEEAIEASPEFIDSDHPPLYKPFTFAEHRKLRITSEMLAGEALDLFRIN